MKKMIMVLAFIAVAIGNAAFAGTGGGEVDKHIRKAFEKEYAGAVNVTWYVFDDYIKVDFSFGGMQLAGFYSKDGRMLGVARNIYFSSLPLMLQIEQKKNYKNYWITGIYELSNGDGTRYYLTLENADQTIKLGSTGSNSWEVVKNKEKQ
jgi:ABC-type glycerol-3-phosphate transport system substrate-binding protein